MKKSLKKDENITDKKPKKEKVKKFRSKESQ